MAAQGPKAAPSVHMDRIHALCLRHGVARLEVFGSAVGDLDPTASDDYFLVTFTPAVRNDLSVFDALKSGLEALLGRPVDLVEREAMEASRNFIRRRIVAEAEAIYG